MTGFRARTARDRGYHLNVNTVPIRCHSNILKVHLASTFAVNLNQTCIKLTEAQSVISYR